MAENNHLQNKKKKSKKLFVIVFLEIVILLLIFSAIKLYPLLKEQLDKTVIPKDNPGTVANGDDNLSPEQLVEEGEQEKLQKELDDLQALIDQADRLSLSYDYDKAIELIKSFKGSEGDYQVYTSLVNAIDRLEKEKADLVLFGNSYRSFYEVSHIYFQPIIAVASRAFDGDNNSKDYNKYNITALEFEKILESLYEQGYVLIHMTDIAKKVTQEDGTTKYVPNEIYLREGKKPIIISEDDVNYYKYMLDDGFASRLVVGEDGKPTCEMLQEDGTTVTGPFDIVPILDAFVEAHPDFSYQGAKGLLTLTGSEGVFGYRTDDPESPTYEADKASVKAVAEALKAEGWEFGCHSWGHKDMKAGDLELLKRDTNRWLQEVGTLIGPTDIYVFPFGNDIEAGSGIYSGEKYQFLKSSGFNVFLGVYKEPWLHVKKNYIRMTRRPIDGQALLEYPDRLADLFNVADIIDSRRPAKDW